MLAGHVLVKISKHENIFRNNVYNLRLVIVITSGVVIGLHYESNSFENRRIFAFEKRRTGIIAGEPSAL